MPETIEALTARIVAAPAPVVFPDTCSILDVIRSVFRLGIQGDVISAARRLTDRAQHIPASIWIVMPEQVAREWHDNSQNVKGELSGVISQTEQQSARLAATASLLLPTERMSRLLLPLKLDEQVFAIAQDVIDSARVIADHAECIARAHTRVVQRIAPSGGPKQQYKDCVVIEHCVALGASLRAQGFGHGLVFVSSNSDDYGKPQSAHPPLDAEFQSIGLEYVANLAWADSLL